VRPGRYKPRILRFWDMTVRQTARTSPSSPKGDVPSVVLRRPTKFFDERVDSVLTVASIDQRATTPGASHAPGAVGRTELPDSAAGLRDDGQPSGAG
jgi:hypothetical protein